MINWKHNAIIVMITLMLITPSYAKGAFTTIKITDVLSGDVIEILGEDYFNLSQFFLFDRCAPILSDDILELENGYEIQRGMVLLGEFEPFDKLVYYPNGVGRRGIIHYVGLVNAQGSPDGSSEYDNHWYFAHPQTEPYLRQLLFGERVIESPFQQAYIRRLTRQC